MTPEPATRGNLRPPRGRMAGLTLLEILVAMAIGLIGIVVITQTYIVNENYKRSTTSAGGAQSSGALAMYSIERDVRMAGWGLSWSSVLGCGTLQWHYNGAYSNPPQAGGTLPAITVAPVVITSGVGVPDTITVFYGSGAERVIPATLAAPMTTAVDNIQIDNSQGFSDTPGDMVLVNSGNTCALMQLTKVTAATGILEHVNSGTALYNPPGGSLLPAFALNSLMFNLGRPVVNTYSIASNNLQLASLFTATSSTVVPAYTPTPNVVVENIIDLQAAYGKDNGVNNATVSATVYTANDGRVDSYDKVTPTDAVGWQQVLSIRIGLLARGDNYEKPATPGGACSATTTTPSWRGGNFNVAGNPDWMCYRYRIFETVVPIRNMIWRQG